MGDYKEMEIFVALRAVRDESPLGLKAGVIVKPMTGYAGGYEVSTMVSVNR
jgi:hypothetical protein